MSCELVFDSWISDRSGQTLDDFEESFAALCGVRNAADAQLVTATVEALAQDYWQGSGIHTPVQWLMWQAGVSRSTARRVLTVAARATELPVTLRLLGEGRLSLEQAHAVARYTPAEYEESVCNLAQCATVNQIINATRQYGFDVEARHPKPDPDRRQASFGFDDDGTWWARLRLAAEEGAVMETALGKVREALHDDARASAREAARLEGRSTDGTDADLGVEPVSWADCFVGLANSIISRGPDGATHAARNKVHLHLEAPTGNAAEVDWLGEIHGGVRLPEWLRRQLCCDTDITVVWQRSGIPLSTCRTQRTPPDRLRRLVERRDHYACRVPGCDTRRWLQLHHIVHWEDGGPTTTDNLVLLCPRHHRMHHQGLLGISGNADLPPGETGSLRFTNEHGLPIPGGATPLPPRLGDLPTAAPYAHPTGEQLQRRHVHFNRIASDAAAVVPGPGATAVVRAPDATDHSAAAEHDAVLTATGRPRGLSPPE